MTKDDLATNVAKRTGIAQKDVAAIIDAVNQEISDSLTRGESVYLRGFATYLVRKRSAKNARVFNTDERIRIPAKMVPAFKPAKAFVNRVAQGNENQL